MKWLGFWLKNSRYVALPQSVMPAIVALSMALPSGHFDFVQALLAFAGVIFAHLGMNLADDYFDYRNKSDVVRNRLHHQGFRARIAKCDYLTSGKATSKQLLVAVIAFLLIAASFGTIILLYRGITILVLAFAGLALGLFYSCPPLKLSYYGLGEIVIGIMFGPLLMTGVYFAACGQIDGTIIFTSIPIGLLVMNIIFTHSVMDQHADKAISKMTFAILLNKKSYIRFAAFLFNFLPFIILLVGVLLGMVHWLYLIAFLTLPHAIWLFDSISLFLDNDKAKQSPKKWLGRMENWQAIKDAGLDWFMIRWYASRNLITSFCIIIILINIILALC
ncbi:MAG: prenyltransferase [Bacteroidales bacterium]|jgi:1,4-dihydroxy-2-naphthoate octaprenyltransferase|nr:prenyltransferase [Bacteroidales bacterium]